MLDERDAAMLAFESLERVHDVGNALARLVARAERALDALGRRSWTEAERILELDRSTVHSDVEAGRISGTMWLIADARLSIHRGDLRTAQASLQLVQVGRSRLSWAIPWHAVRALTVLAGLQLQVGDGGGARASVTQAREVLRVRPSLGAWNESLMAMAERTRRSQESQFQGSSLTRAELRLLPYLQTHLSFKEVGERLGISATTVKTQAMSIYSKVGATSRSEAVEQAIACGLLDDPFALLARPPV